MEVINVTYYDPAHSIFKGTSKDREYVKIFYCDRKDECTAYQHGTCVLLNGLWGHGCPNGRVQKIEGYTKYASKYGDLLYKYKTQYKDQCYALELIKHVECLGNYWYLNLPWLDCTHNARFKFDDEKAREYQCSMTNYFKERIVDENLVKAEDFTVEFITRLLDFRPTSYMAGVITDYADKKLPQFCYDLRKYYPSIYEEVKAVRPDIEGLANQVTFKGKRAKLLTLNPGKVKVNTMTFDWDGKQIITTADKAHMWGNLKDACVTIVPTENSVVEIIDDNTVNDDTEFV